MKCLMITLIAIGLGGGCTPQSSATLHPEDTLTSALASGLLDYAVSGGTDAGGLAGTLAAEMLGHAASQEGSLDRATNHVATRLTGVRHDEPYSGAPENGIDNPLNKSFYSKD